MDLRFSIYDLRASCIIAQAFSFGVAKTKRGHNKTCNFAKRSQIPRRLVFQSSCCEAGNCEKLFVIFSKGNFEKRSQFIHLRSTKFDLRFEDRQQSHIATLRETLCNPHSALHIPHLKQKSGLVRLSPAKKIENTLQKRKAETNKRGARSAECGNLNPKITKRAYFIHLRFRIADLRFAERRMQLRFTSQLQYFGGNDSLIGL
jgi:hypothetical protein